MLVGCTNFDRDCVNEIILLEHRDVIVHADAVANSRLLQVKSMRFSYGQLQKRSNS